MFKMVDQRLVDQANGIKRKSISELQVGEITRELEKKDQAIGKTSNNSYRPNKKNLNGKKIVIAQPIRKE